MLTVQTWSGVNTGGRTEERQLLSVVYKRDIAGALSMSQRGETRGIANVNEGLDIVKAIFGVCDSMAREAPSRDQQGRYIPQCRTPPGAGGTIALITYKLVPQPR